MAIFEMKHLFHSGSGIYLLCEITFPLDDLHAWCALNVSLAVHLDGATLIVFHQLHLWCNGDIVTYRDTVTYWPRASLTGPTRGRNGFHAEGPDLPTILVLDYFSDAWHNVTVIRYCVRSASELPPAYGFWATGIFELPLGTHIC